MTKSDRKNRCSHMGQGKNILSMHPIIEGDAFYWDRGVRDKNLFNAIKKASAIILPQTVEKELYCHMSSPIMTYASCGKAKWVIRSPFGHTA
jgi:hypothetical protein